MKPLNLKSPLKTLRASARHSAPIALSRRSRMCTNRRSCIKSPGACWRKIRRLDTMERLRGPASNASPVNRALTRLVVVTMHPQDARRNYPPSLLRRERRCWPLFSGGPARETRHDREASCPYEQIGAASTVPSLAFGVLSPGLAPNLCGTGRGARTFRRRSKRAKHLRWFFLSAFEPTANSQWRTTERQGGFRHVPSASRALLAPQLDRRA